MTIAFIALSYKRPEILRLYMEGVERLRFQCDVLLHNIVCGDGAEVVRDYDCMFLSTANHPLTTRFNLACARARETTPDYVCMMGSDNIINHEVIDYVVAHPEYDYINPKDIYFLNSRTGEMIYILTNHIGCCRFIHRGILDKTNWRLAPDKLRGLDQHVTWYLRPHMVNPHHFIGANMGAITIDVKSEDSINGFFKWDKCKRINPQPVLQFLSDKERDILNKLRHDGQSY